MNVFKNPGLRASNFGSFEQKKAIFRPTSPNGPFSYYLMIHEKLRQQLANQKLKTFLPAFFEIVKKF